MSNILIIDDDPDFCGALSGFLQQEGHKVTAVLDGKSGLTAAQANPDLIICDIKMPVLNGHEVIDAVRQTKGMAEVPFIFISGAANRDTVRKSMNSGADDFIAKPANPAEILEAVNSRLKLVDARRRQKHEEVGKAVHIFSGIVDDLGGAEAAIHWLTDAAASGFEYKKLLSVPLENSSGTVAGRESQNVIQNSFMMTKGNTRKLIRLSEVKVLRADAEYSWIHWGAGQKMLFRKTLKCWEKTLPASQFIRIHRNAIINLAFLDYVSKASTGRPVIHLKEFDEPLEVSHRKISMLNRRLKDLQFSKHFAESHKIQDS